MRENPDTTTVHRSSHRRRSLKIAVLVLLLLLLAAVGTGFYLTRRYHYEWVYWKWLPAEVKRQAVELELERLWHRILPPKPEPSRYAHVTATLLQERMRLGADWLLSMQEDSGRFRYWYRPDDDLFSTSASDNFLRQAGTGYSLTLVYQMTGDPSYLQAAERNLNYLLRYRMDLGEDKSYFLFKQKAKLGGIALPMLTMLNLRAFTGETRHDKLLTRLANMILYQQEQYGSGQFKSTYVYKGDYEHERNTGWESRIYPGEAMLALAMMYRTFGNERYKRSIDWAIEYYSKWWRWRNHAFLAWTIAAMMEMYERTGEAHYAGFGLKLGDHVIRQQNLDPDDEVYGSFHGLPTANTGSYIEGLGDAIRLARLRGNMRRVERYVEHARMGYRWLCLLQYTPENSLDLIRPDAAIGGIRYSLFDSELRIDNTQHAISSFAKGLRSVFRVAPVVALAETLHDSRNAREDVAGK